IQLTNQHKLSNEWSIKTHELLEDITQNFNISESIQNNLDQLYNVITNERTALDIKQTEYNSLLANSSEELTTYWNENTEILLQNKNQFTELNSALSQSMNDFADHMYRGIQHTFEKFDDELTKAVEHLARGVSTIQMVV